MILVIGFRLITVAGLIGLWFLTQNLLSQRGMPEGEIGDKLHQWLAAPNRYLNDQPAAARLLLITSSLGVDLLGVTVLGWGIFGPSLRPLVGLTILMMLRQLSQYLTALPAPQGMIWRDPGVPSLFVTYGVSNDLFFSGHTALAVFGGLTLATISPSLVWVGVGLALFEVFTVLALRAHWTMDVYAGAVTAVLVFVATHG
ncbi:MAG: phosphatase PAP2 family protein [Proteobacteria bacterium]|nr:phosphatase PAP2 family protein [Pseudomonadota bacterium]